MIEFLLRRAIQAAIAMFFASLLVFFAIYAIGDPVQVLVHPAADQAEIERATRALGLDKPVWQQFLVFLANAAKGDLGTSFVFNQPALELILQRLPATIELAVLSLLISVCIGLPLGLLAALRPNRFVGRTIMAGSILGFSVPSFWVGVMLIMLFAVKLDWVPAAGRGDTGTFLGITSSLFTWDGLKHAFLPSVNLSLLTLALVIRLTYTGMRENLVLDYVKFARAKGLSEARVIWLHVLPNALIPIITVLGLVFGATIASAVVTETVFSWPGTGKLLVDSINNLDRPVVVAYIMVIVVIFVSVNLLVDVASSWIDPRLREKR